MDRGGKAGQRGGGGQGPGGRLVRLASPVSLRRLVQELVAAADNVMVYLNTRTGEFVPVTEDMAMLARRDAAALERGPAWERRAAARVREVENADTYVALPDRGEIGPYHVRGRFAASIEDDAIRAAFEEALRGRGAVRRFRRLIQRHHLEKAWDAFETAAYVEIARGWLAEHGLPVKDDLAED